MKKTILLGLIVASIVATSTIAFSTAVFAQKNGWGEATSEEAREDGKAFGGHASGQDDDPNGPGDPPFDDDGKSGRNGLGNLGLHPNDLGEFLDCADQDDDDDPPADQC